MTITEETITLIPPGKLRCVITGKLRKDTPEEHVRQRIARSLIEDYGYDRSDIAVEFGIKMGRSRKRVDITIFPPRVEHKQENIKIIIECKREDVRPTDRDNGVEQLKSYLAACPNARFGMWVGSELQVWERIVSPTGEVTFEEATDIPRFGYDAPQPITFAELVPAQKEYGVPFLRPSHLPQMRPYDLGYISRLTKVLDSLILHRGDVTNGNSFKY